ncbi:MAG: ABC transporter permease [Bryobacterales bacterium]|nr:ABC transporter permease [Bryobacterales bacterium]
MSLRRTAAMARKEILHILRDPGSLASAIFHPLMMLLLFSYALSLDVADIPLVVYNQDPSPQANALIQDFRGSRYFVVVEQVDSYVPLERAFDQRRAMMGLVIPADYARNVARGNPTPIQLLLDGSDSNTAQIAQGYADGIIQAHARRLRDSAEAARTGVATAPPVDTRSRVWYNPDLVSRNYIVPGLIAVIIMIISAMLTSLTIAREWDNGTMEQLLSTPVRPAEIALGKLAAYFLLGALDMLIALFVALYVFDVPFKGNPVLLFFSSCIYLFGALGWGIFLSAATRSQLAAYQLGIFTSFLPAFLLSGFIYSIANMPPIIQFVALFVPARYFINIIKGVFLKGVGLEILWLDFLLLCGYAVFVFFIATRSLRGKVG